MPDYSQFFQHGRYSSFFEEEEEKPGRRSVAQTLLTDPARALGASVVRKPSQAVDLVDFLQKLAGPMAPLLPAGLGQFPVAGAREGLEPVEELAETVAPPPASNWPGKVLQAVGGAAPDVAAMIAGGPVAGTAYAAGLIAPQSFKEAEARGVSRPVAAGKAITEAAIGAVLERVGVKKLAALLRPLGPGPRRKLAGEVLEASGLEATTEGAQELVALALEAATGKEFAEGEVAERLTVAPAAGAAMGGGVGAVSIALPGRAGQEQREAAQRYLTVQKGLDQAEHKVTEQARHGAKAEIMRARQVALELQHQVDQALGWNATSNFRPEHRQRRQRLNETVHNYITAPEDAKPALAATIANPDVLTAADEARQMLTTHSLRFLNSPWLTPEQRAVVEANLFSYMRRSFRIHDDPEGLLAEHWEGGVPSPEWVAAREWLGTQEQDLSDAELDRKLRSLFRVHQVSVSDPARGQYVSPELQMIERSPFMRRKGEDVLPPEILKLFGEYKTPEVSFIKSIERTANAYHRTKMYEALVQGGLAKGLLHPGGPPGGELNTEWLDLKTEAGTIGQELVRMQPLRKARVLDEGPPEVRTDAPAAYRPSKSSREVELADGGTARVPVDLVAQRADLWGQENFLKSLDLAMKTNPWFGVKADAGNIVKLMVGGAKLAGAVKAGLTVYQPQAQMRNLQSNTLAIFAGANVLPGPWDSPWFKPQDATGADIEQFKFFRAARTAAGVALAGNELIGPKFLRGTSRKAQPMATKLARLGVSGGSVDAGDSEFFFGQALSRLEAGGSLLKQAVAKPLRLGQKLYYAGDDVAKAMMFFRERQKLLWLYEKPLRKGLATVEQLEAEAAEIVQQTGQNYDRLPQLVRDLRAVPVVAPFLSFPVAATINLKNQVKRGMQETGAHSPDEVSILGDVSPDPRRALAVGAARLVSTATAAAGAASAVQGLVLAARTALGEALDKDLEPITDVSLLPFNDGQTMEDMLRAEPWWGQASNHVILHKENGKIWSLDFSYMNYFNYLERPILAAMRSGIYDDDPFDAALDELVQPFAAQDILFGALLRVYNNEDQYANPIYEIVEDKQGRVLKGDPWEQLKAGMDHLLLSFAGPYKTGRRLYKKFQEEGDTLSGSTYDQWTELLALGGPRVKITDFERTLSHRARDQKDALNKMRRATNKILREPGTVNPQAAQTALEVDVQAAELVFRRLQELYQAGLRQGAPKAALDLVLIAGQTGLSKVEAAGIMEGQDPAEMARAWAQKAVPSAQKYRTDRMARAIASWQANHPDATPEEQREERERLSKIYPPIVIPGI